MRVIVIAESVAWEQEFDNFLDWCVDKVGTREQNVNYKALSILKILSEEFHE